MIDSMLKVFKIDENNLVWECLVNDKGEIVKKIKRKDKSSPFIERKEVTKRKKRFKNKPIKKEVLTMETEIMTQETTAQETPKLKRVSTRIKELIKEGKSDDEIIAIVKSELANNELLQVATPVSVYLRDIRCKIKSGRIKI